MRFNSKKRLFILWIATFALFAVRMVEAHIHLCLDGQDSPTELHAWDTEASCQFHDADHSSKHNDIDLDAQGVVIAESSDVKALALLPVNAVLLQLLPPTKRSSIDRPTALENLPPHHPYLFMPLLRGPPV